MARPPLAIGAWGRISRTPVERERTDDNGRTRYVDHHLVADNKLFYRRADTGRADPRTPDAWVARARFRDFDGRTRKVEAWGPTGAAAEKALIAQLLDRSAPTSDALTGDTTITALWQAYRARLVADGKATRTVERYDYLAGKIVEAMGGVRIREVTTQSLDGFVRAVGDHNGPTVAKTARVVLSGMFRLAVQFDACSANPVREVQVSAPRSKAARALTVDEVRAVLNGVRSSPAVMPPASGRKPGRVSVAEYCRSADLTDLVVFLADTGCRISEVLGVRWSDVNLEAKTVSVTGHVVSARGGLVRESGAKTDAGERVLPLPAFAVAMLLARQVDAVPNPHDVVFPSGRGTLRDPDGVSKQWRRVRAVLGFDWVTSHTFRKTLATIADSAGLSARAAADHLGHSHVSMTQDVYFGRGQSHAEIADAVDRAIGS